jgi:hypothetical protein
MCGLFALVVYLLLWARDTGGRTKRRPGQFDAYHQGTYPALPPDSRDPYYANTADGPYITPVTAESAYSYDSPGAGSYCPRCGTAQEPGSAFCLQCGERVPTAGQGETAASPTHPVADGSLLYPPPGAAPPPVVDLPTQSAGGPSVPPAPPIATPPSHTPPGPQGKPKPSEWK